jgi:hypothetical protein
VASGSVLALQSGIKSYPCGAHEHDHGARIIRDIQVRFQVLTATSMKLRAFWDIAPCSVAEVS